MMYNFILADFNDNLIECLRFNLYSGFSIIEEILLDKEALDSELVVGRTMDIDDTASMLLALGVKSEEEFESYLQDKADKGTLTIEYMVRICENNGLTYNVEGHKLRYEFNQFNKKKEEEKIKGWIEAREECREARKYMHAVPTTYPLDMHKAYLLLSDASLKRAYPPAYGLMANYYMKELEWGLAAQYALEGAECGDLKSMHLLALLYEQGTDFVNFTNNIGVRDYDNAVRWCKEAAMRGLPEGMNMFNRLIHEGHIDPKSEEIVKILEICARKQTKFNKKYNKQQLNK